MKILYVQYTNPGGYPPLEHSSKIFAEEGGEVLFLGTGSFGAGGLSFPPHPHITIKQLSFCPPGWRQKLHYLCFCIWVLAWTVRWKPKWVYASDLLSCPIALLLSFFPHLKLIYHEHDSPSQPGSTAFLRFCLTTRKWLAHRAALCILPNHQRIKHFEQEVGIDRNTVCVWNCPAKAEVAPVRSPLHQDLWVLYHGSIVPERLPIAVLRALADLPRQIKLRVIGYETVGHLGYVKQLQTIANELEIGERIEFLKAMPRHELMKYCQLSDVGLALMPMTSQDVNLYSMVGASNKPFDYLACGLPLLVSQLPDWEDMYVKPGYGLACDPEDPTSIADALRWYLEHPVEMREMGDRGRQRILNEWNYEMQFQPIYQQIQRDTCKE